MKETGLMFKAPLVRAILSGQKAQTRRICKPAVAHNLSQVVEVPDPQEHGQVYNGSTFGDEEGDIQFSSPFGGLGDRIYVRETFLQGYDYDPVADRLRQYDEDGNELPKKTWYRATDNQVTWTDEDGWESNTPWRPSIHMPKALARIWLEITCVRVERLQDISEEDAKAEGAPIKNSPAAYLTSYRRGFQDLWESTGGDWSANPWVWVIDFKRIEQPAPKEAP